MEIEASAIYTEVKRIFESGKTTANMSWEVLIHFSEEELPLRPVLVHSINLIRDYVNGYAEEFTISVVLPLGDYAHLVYPNRTQLEITLVQKQLNEFDAKEDSDAQPQSERYKAVLIDEGQAPTVAQGQEQNGREALNRSQLFTCNFQLINKSVEQIRIMATGGVFRDANVEDTMKSILTNALTRTKVTVDRAIVGVELLDVDNTDVKQQLIIPHGTRVVDMPGTLQERYGVYNSGIGSFIQGIHWFVYPLYNTTVFNTRQQTLTLYILPKRKFPEVERTFEQIDDDVIAIVTGQTGFQDDSGTNSLNSGNGARFTSADDLMKSPVTTGGNKAKISRTKNNREFVATPNAGLNHVAFKERRITANPFPVYSELAATNGGMLRCVWQNSDPSLVLPGMATKITYLEGDDIKHLYGVVHRMSHINHNLGSIGNPRFKGHTLLDIFVNSQVTPIDE